MLAWCSLIRQTSASLGFAIAKRANGVTARRKGPKGVLWFWVAGRKLQAFANRSNKDGWFGNLLCACATFPKRLMIESFTYKFNPKN